MIQHRTGALAPTLAVLTVVLAGCPPDGDGSDGGSDADGYDEGYAEGYAAAKDEQSDELAALAGQLSELATQVEALQGAGFATEDWVSDGFVASTAVDDLDDRLSVVEADHLVAADLAPLDNLLAVVSVDSTGQSVTFHDVNVFIQSGSGATDDDSGDGGTLTGLGNLVIGYDEPSGDGTDVKTGSHNLVVGPYHSYSSYGGVVFGYDNAVSGPDAGVLGGQANVASGAYSLVVAGYDNQADGAFSAILAGKENITSGDGSAVVTGAANEVAGDWAGVLGGYENTAGGLRSMVVGGSLNETGSYWHCAILGGLGQACTENLETVY